MALPETHNIEQWLAQNEKFLEPPVMNKLMYGAGQLKVMFVGGPNIRSDYHLEEGEELFYMHRGDMVVKLLVKNQFVDVPIKEGELFLLPGRIPHSPQRFSHTIGLVIERDREEDETDCLRWYVPDQAQAEVLYEEYFHCFDLGQQLKPVIQRFFASEEKKTGVPTKKLIAQTSNEKASDESSSSRPPITPDPTIDVPAPFPLASTLSALLPSIMESEMGLVALAPGPTASATTLTSAKDREFQLYAIAGPNASKVIHCRPKGEVWLWQFSGSSSLSVYAPSSLSAIEHHSNPELSNLTTAKLKSGASEEKKVTLSKLDSQLIPVDMPFVITPNKAQEGEESITIAIAMVPLKREAQKE